MEKNKKVKVKSRTGEEVEIIGGTYEAGKPTFGERLNWLANLTTREEKLKYIKTAHRYWYSKDWYGSEKRKNPA
ncbi:MAG: hypothetical protein GXP49_09645 [Deltaproteobacteria bacterium]|nr:hypothetical protein [Deltaproteobacteria bacterium]